MMVEQIFLVVLVFLLCYLLVIILLPSLTIRGEELTAEKQKKMIPDNRRDVDILLEKDTLRAWLYLPEGSDAKSPCVILSHGLGGTKDAVLEAYALRFTANGIAAITYDYRYFGESDGKPRQLYHGLHQQEDLRAVIEYAMAHDRIDDERIVLWSTSAAGRYGINAASEDPKIAGVIAQCPSLNHRKDESALFKREGFGFFLKLFIHAQRDKGRSRLGLSPDLIPIVGKPGALSFLNAPGAFDGYERLMQGSSTFINGICGRSLFIWPGPNAAKTAGKVKCRVLIQTCQYDNIIPQDSHEKVASILGEKASVITYPIGHFDIYQGEYFEQAVNDQIRFVKSVRAMEV